MRKFGLIGYPLTHSFSRKYFEEKFKRENISDCSYDLFPLKNIDEFPGFLESNPDLHGLNVTIPYKESVTKFLDTVNDEAEEIGAVNCIRWDNGELKGYNTDCYGFEKCLIEFVGHNFNENAEGIFVLGTGGSSKAVQFVLEKLKLSYYLVSRERKQNSVLYNEVESLMKWKNLFINTTPVGMFPNIEEAPQIPYHRLSYRDFLFDLIYNPSETLFLKRGKEKGAKTKNGIKMLELQAEKSWEIWNL